MEIERIKRNIAKMADKGATEQEIDAYVDGEGVTIVELRRHKNKPKGVLDQALDIGDNLADFTGAKYLYNQAADAAGSVYDAYQGDIDPAFKGLEGFSGQGLAFMGDKRPAIERGKVTTLTDEGYAGIIKKNLADQLLKSEKDKFGQEVITYKGDDGKEYQTYINKPGLDYQDVDRFANSALPFVATAGIAGQLAKGLGLAGRSVAQGVTAGITDSAMQKASQDQGSGEDYSLARSLAAGLGGAGGELLGTAITKLTQRGYIDKATGKLNERGRAWAKANKIDPDEASESVTNYLSQNIDRAADPEELAVSARLGEFGIESTKAQRTKSPTDAFNELRMEKGLMGREAESAVKNFKKTQGEAIESAAFDKVAKELAPEGGGVDRSEIGGSVRDGLNKLFDDATDFENKLWSEIGPMYPQKGAFDSMPDIISKKADEAGLRLLPRGTEASADMVKTMQKFMNGDLKTSGAGLLKSGAIKNGKDVVDGPVNIDEARRILLATKNTAEPGSPDARLANKLYEGFNNWIDDAAEKALIVSDDPAAHAALKGAREISFTKNKFFFPKGKDGKLTPAGKKIKQLLDHHDSPESVVSELFGRGTSVTELPKHTYQTLQHLKLGLSGGEVEGTKAVFDSLKLAYWVRLVQDKNGKVLSSTKIHKNLNDAFNLQKSAMNIMFNKKELALIKRFSQAMKDLHVDHPNPSLSSIGVGHLAKQLGKQAAQTQSKRELFSKHNVLMSRIYAMIAKSIDTPVFNPGRALSRRATGQEITKRSTNKYISSGGLGALYSAEKSTAPQK